MTSFSRNARIAGLLYLTLLTAPLRLIYIPSKLFVAACEESLHHVVGFKSDAKLVAREARLCHDHFR